MKKSDFIFFLNPYKEYSFTKCPKCEKPTRLRKFCLMIHYEDKSAGYHQLFSMNKTCRFCPDCQMIIAKKTEVDEWMGNVMNQLKRRFDPANYFIFGTMDRNDWKAGKTSPPKPAEILDKVLQFKDVVSYEVRPAGWYFDDDNQKT